MQISPHQHMYIQVRISPKETFYTVRLLTPSLTCSNLQLSSLSVAVKPEHVFYSGSQKYVPTFEPTLHQHF